MERLIYLTDLTDEQWLIVEPYVRTSGLGRKPKHQVDEAAVNQYPGCFLDASDGLCGGDQNASSGMSAQVRSRLAATCSQASIFGNS